MFKSFKKVQIFFIFINQKILYSINFNVDIQSNTFQYDTVFTWI